jgi:hypothetical protein
MHRRRRHAGDAGEPGQGIRGTARAPAGLLAVVVVRDRKSGRGVRYSVKDTWMARSADWNKALDPMGRYQAVMSAEGLFEAEPAP